MEILKYKYIAIDFDGTIAEEGNFPIIGTMLKDADRVINKIKHHGGTICIWTCRSGSDLENAINWLYKHNIPFDWVNQDFPEIANQYVGFTRKLCAQIYIDNKDIAWVARGGIDWNWIEEQLFERVEEFGSLPRMR